MHVQSTHAAKAITDTVRLPNGVEMPVIGFGVYLSPADLTVASCLTALRLDYRHIDTAQYYMNEGEVGRATERSGLPREALFLTTKIYEPAGSVQGSFERCVESARKVDPAGDAGGRRKSYLDLFLIHAPSEQRAAREEIWLALEKMHAEGRARSIGVSNYGIGHIEEMKQYASVWPPHANQIELHPWAQQRRLVAYCKEKGILVQAYCPIARNTRAEDPTLKRIAAKHGVTTQQALMRFSLQKGWVPLIKSDKEGRIRSNVDIFGFELDAGDMADFDALDQGDDGIMSGWPAIDNDLP